MTKEDKIILAIYMALSAIIISCAFWCGRSAAEIKVLSKEQTRDLKVELNNFWIQQKYLEQEVAELKVRLQRAVKTTIIMTNSTIVITNGQRLSGYDFEWIDVTNQNRFRWEAKPETNSPPQIQHGTLGTIPSQYKNQFKWDADAAYTNQNKK